MQHVAMERSVVESLLHIVHNHNSDDLDCSGTLSVQLCVWLVCPKFAWMFLFKAMEMMGNSRSHVESRIDHQICHCHMLADESKHHKAACRASCRDPPGRSRDPEILNPKNVKYITAFVVVTVS